MWNQHQILIRFGNFRNDCINQKFYQHLHVLEWPSSRILPKFENPTTTDHRVGL